MSKFFPLRFKLTYWMFFFLLNEEAYVTHYILITVNKHYCTNNSRSDDKHAFPLMSGKYLSLENNRGQGNWPRATVTESIPLSKHISLNNLNYLI